MKFPSVSSLEKWFLYQRKFIGLPPSVFDGLVLPSRELKSGGVIKLEELSLMVFGKTCAYARMCTYYNTEGNGTSVGVCLAEFQLNTFDSDSI